MSPSLLTENNTVLTIPDRTALEKAVHWILPPAPRGQKPVIRIVAGLSTRVKVILEEIQPGSGVYENQGTLEIRLARGACVDLFMIQRLGEHSKSVWENHYYLKQHASLDTMIFSIGEGCAEHQSHVTFEEEHGFCSFKGLSILKAQARGTYRAVAEHRAGHSISRQHFKNIVTGSARSEVHSLVDVSVQASGTDSRQLCRNLLLSDTARGTACPTLKINTDDVACSHGATTGPLDAQELFYLKSRGLVDETAKRLLIGGFAMEVLEGVQDAEMKKRIAWDVDGELRELS